MDEAAKHVKNCDKPHNYPFALRNGAGQNYNCFTGHCGSNYVPPKPDKPSVVSDYTEGECGTDWPSWYNDYDDCLQKYHREENWRLKNGHKPTYNDADLLEAQFDFCNGPLLLQSGSQVQRCAAKSLHDSGKLKAPKKGDTGFFGWHWNDLWG